MDPSTADIIIWISKVTTSIRKVTSLDLNLHWKTYQNLIKKSLCKKQIHLNLDLGRNTPQVMIFIKCNKKVKKIKEIYTGREQIPIKGEDSLWLPQIESKNQEEKR